MKNSLEKRILESTIAGAFQFALTLFQSIILVPLFLKFWGNEKYGIWLAILSFVTMLRTIDLGHQNFIGTEFQIKYHTDKKKARSILGSSVRIALVLGFLELVIFLVLVALGLDIKLIGYETGNDLSIRTGIFILVLMWWAVGSMGGILVRVILPLGLYARSVYLSLIIRLAEIVILLFCSSMNSGIFWVCFWFAFASFFYTLFIMWDIKKIMPNFYPWWTEGSWYEGYSNLKKSIVLTFTGFIEQFNTNGIILIISSLLQASLVPIFTTIKTVTNMVSQLTLLITGPLIPELIRFQSTGQYEKTRHIFSTNWLISGLIVNISLVIMVVFIEPLYIWWTAGKLNFDSTLFFLLSLSVCIINFGRSYYNYLYGMNHLKALTTITIFRFLILSLTLILLLPSLGLIGLGWSLLLSEVVASWIIPSWIIKKFFRNLKPFTFKKDELLALLSIASVATCYIYVYLFPTINTIVPVLITVFFMLLIAKIQWSSLDNEVKLRLLDLMKKH